MSTNTDGTGAIRTLDGTAVPTLSAMFTFVARGALFELMTVSRILVFCSVLSVTLEPPAAAVFDGDAEPAAPPRAESVAWFRWPPCWTDSLLCTCSFVARGLAPRSAGCACEPWLCCVVDGDWA